VRAVLTAVLDKYDARSIQKDLDSLEPKERLDMIAKLAEYCTPKMARTEHTGEDGGAIRYSSDDLAAFLGKLDSTALYALRQAVSEQTSPSSDEIH